MKRRHVKSTYLPPKLPIFSTITLWLLLDKLQLSTTWLAVIWTIWGIYLVLNIAYVLYWLFTSKSSAPVWQDDNE